MTFPIPIEEQERRGSVLNRVGNAGKVETDSIYNVIVTTLTAYNEEKSFEATGDHLYIAELNGSQSIYVKVGSRRNSWIRVLKGDTIKRKFSRVYLKAFDDFKATGGVSIVAYASTGPFVDRQYPKSGLDRGFGAACNVNAGTNWADFFAGLGYVATKPLTVGKAGGVLYVTNQSDTTPIFLRYGPRSLIGTAGAPFGIGSFMIRPNQSVVFNLNSQISGVSETLLVAASVGSTPYTYLVSPYETDTATEGAPDQTRINE